MVCMCDIVMYSCIVMLYLCNFNRFLHTSGIYLVSSHSAVHRVTAGCFNLSLMCSALDVISLMYLSYFIQILQLMWYCVK